MRILIAHNQYRVRGGEDVVVERESAELERRGHEVRKFLVRSGDKSAVGAAIEASFCSSYSAKSRDAFAAVIREFRPDVVHVHNFFPFLTPSIYDACLDAGVPVVQSLHNFRLVCANGLLLRDGKNCEICIAGSPWNAVRYGCYRDSRLASIPVARMIARHRQEGTWARKVDALLAVTHFGKRKFVEAGLPEARLHEKRNFVPDLSSRYRREEGDYALFVGRLSQEKGLGTLLRAWRGSRIPLRVIGDGPMESVLASAGIRAETGRSQDDVMKALSKARFLVFPTECYEGGFPLVAVEAMMLGVPVVTSRFGSAEEVFRHGENALLFSPGDADALRREVERCHSDAALRMGLAKQGRAAYEVEFTPEKILSQLEGIYLRVISGKAN